MPIARAAPAAAPFRAFRPPFAFFCRDSMIRRCTLLSCLATIVCGASAAHAQAPLPDTAGESAPAHVAARSLAVGDTVQIRCAGARYVGRIARLTDDSLVVSRAGGEDAVARGDVAELLRLTGRGPRGRTIAIGAGVGLVGGAALGFVGGRMAGHITACDAVDPNCTPGSHDRTAEGAFTAVGALVGSLVGAMTGPVFRRAHWEPISPVLQSARIEAAPSPAGGMQLQGSLRI
jgi:hypothetical protein